FRPARHAVRRLLHQHEGADALVAQQPGVIELAGVGWPWRGGQPADHLDLVADVKPAQVAGYRYLRQPGDSQPVVLLSEVTDPQDDAGRVRPGNAAQRVAARLPNRDGLGAQHSAQHRRAWV